MKATIDGFGYEKSTPAHMKQGVKGNYTPKGAVAGGNGTFIMAGDPPKVMVDCTNENGEQFSVDMYGVIKMNSDRRVTEKYVNGLLDDAVGSEFEMGKDPRTGILGLIAEKLE